jgi:putative phage-type endonuclease
MITDKQRDERTKGIGSSEVSTVLGLNRWQTPHDLWLIKTGRAPGVETNEAMRIGQVLEPTLLQFAGERLGRKVVRPSTTFVGALSHMRSNIDGMVDKAQRGADIVEVKTTGVTEGWGREGTDEVPDAVKVQVMWQMLCASSGLAHVACLMGSFGLSFKLYRVEWDEVLADYLNDRVHRWWQEHVVKDTPPPGAASIDTLKAVQRTDAEITLPLELFEREAAAKQALGAAEADYEKAKAALVTAMGTARRATNGVYSVTVTEVATDRFDRKSFEAEHAELASRYIVPAGYKRIDIRKRKDTDR